jgi:hypothetical protein
MPYFGQVEIEVRLMREGHGIEGKDMAPVAKRVVRLSEHDAEIVRDTVEKHSGGTDADDFYGLLSDTAEAVKAVLDEDEGVELDRRWREAERAATPERRRAALAVLEGRET